MVLRMSLLTIFLFLVSFTAIYLFLDIQYKLHKKDEYSKKEFKNDKIAVCLFTSSSIILTITILSMLLR